MKSLRNVVVLGGMGLFVGAGASVLAFEDAEPPSPPECEYEFEYGSFVIDAIGAPGDPQLMQWADSIAGHAYSYGEGVCVVGVSVAARFDWPDGFVILDDLGMPEAMVDRLLPCGSGWGGGDPEGNGNGNGGGLGEGWLLLVAAEHRLHHTAGRLDEVSDAEGVCWIASGDDEPCDEHHPNWPNCDPL